MSLGSHCPNDCIHLGLWHVNSNTYAERTPVGSLAGSGDQLFDGRVTIMSCWVKFIFSMCLAASYCIALGETIGSDQGPHALLKSASQNPAIEMEPRWLIPKLDGVRSFHLGANCFNAVLAAKGFTDRLRFSDGAELRYFLEKFCTKAPGWGSPGDILAVVRRGRLDHAAIKLGNRTIFDKNSNVGLNDGALDSADSFYGKRKLSRSGWFSGCRAPKCRVESFKCEGHKVVRQQLKHCLTLSDRLGFGALFRELEAQTLNPLPRVNLSPKTRRTFDRVVDALRAINGDEECASFLLTQGLSAISHWDLLTLEGNEELNSVIQGLRDRVLRFDRTASTLKIIGESDWKPIWRPF